MKKKLAAILLCVGMVANMALPLVANETEDFVVMQSETGEDEEVGFLVPVEQQTEVPEGYIGIYTAEDLDNVRNDLDANYILMNDIDLSEYENWVPIGTENCVKGKYFSGTFDGNGYYIGNITIGISFTEAMTYYIGIFGAVNGTIENLEIRNINYQIENNGEPATPGEQSTIIHIGGIVGYANNASFYNCVSGGVLKVTENVDSSTPVGGCVGYSSHSNVSYCYNKMDIYHTNNEELTGENNTVNAIGGLVGTCDNYKKQSLHLTHCVNVGNIYVNGNGGLQVGGICGYAEYKSIIGNKNMGKITVISDNNVYNYGKEIGGIIGSTSQTTDKPVTIENSHNIGDIIFKSQLAFAAVGGICGHTFSTNSAENNYDFKINDCYNSGNVIVENPSSNHSGYLGGIIGRISNNTATINYCYNIGEVSSKSTNEYSSSCRGSIVGISHNNVSVQCCYYNNTDLSVIGEIGYNSEGIILDCNYLSNSEMQSESSFVGFDFDTVWEIGVTEGYPYPTLRDNPHNGSPEVPDSPSIVLTVSVNQQTKIPTFKFTAYPGATKHYLEVYNSKNELCFSEVGQGATDYFSLSAGNVKIKGADTYTAYVYVILDDDVRIMSNTVTYTIPDSNVVLTVVPGTSNTDTYFCWDTNQEITESVICLNKSNNNIGDIYISVGSKNLFSRYLEPGTYTACVLVHYSDGVVAATKTVDFTVGDEVVTTSISTTFDTSAITLAEGETFDFAGIVSTTAENGLEAVQIDIHKYGDDGIGITHFRTSNTDEENPLTGNIFDLFAIPSFKGGDILTGQTDNTITLSAGTSWNVYLYAKDTDGNTLGGSVVKRIDIVEAEIEQVKPVHAEIECTDLEDYAGNYRDFTVIFDELPTSAYLQFDNQHNPDEWLSDEYCSTNPAFMIDLSMIEETNDGYEYNTTFIIHSEGLESNDYARKVRVAVPTESGISYSDAFTFYVNPIPEHPQTTMGIAYEQTLDISDDTLPPAINAVIATKEQDKNKNIYYRLSVLTYTADDDANIFFYWETDGGEFQKVNDDYTEVDFIPDGTNNVTVYMGDGLGYVASYTLTIEE